MYQFPAFQIGFCFLYYCQIWYISGFSLTDIFKIVNNNSNFKLHRVLLVINFKNKLNIWTFWKENSSFDQNDTRCILHLASVYLIINDLNENVKNKRWKCSAALQWWKKNFWYTRNYAEIGVHFPLMYVSNSMKI